MHKNILRTLPVAAALFIAACNSGGNSARQDAAAVQDSLAIDSLSTEVMAIHDEGMAKMMVIRRLRTRVAEITDSLGKKKGDTTAWHTAGSLLDSANNAMNEWMHGYDMEMTGKDNTQKKAYLESEKQKISTVKDLMLKSIDEAKILLKEQ